MGWHAPCELLRTSSSSALSIGLWSRAQIHFAEDIRLICTLFYLRKENKQMCSRRGLFMYNPRLTDFYNGLGEKKLPPEPLK
jgi:hypothetical protein